MGACNSAKNKSQPTMTDKSVKPVIVKQDKLSEKTIFDGIICLPRCE
jgi:hypothetical protein